jgi:hypothetical protein
MIDSEARAAAIARLRHIQRQEVVPQPQVVTELLRGQGVTIQHVGVASEPCPGLAGSVQSPRKLQLSTLKRLGESLLRAVASLAAALRYLPHTLAMIVGVEKFLFQQRVDEELTRTPRSFKRRRRRGNGVPHPNAPVPNAHRQRFTELPSDEVGGDVEQDWQELLPDGPLEGLEEVGNTFRHTGLVSCIYGNCSVTVSTA